MKIVYCEKWWRSKRKVISPIDENQAFKRFQSKKGFFSVFFNGNENIPVCFIEFFEGGDFSVCYLDAEANEVSSFVYQKLDLDEINPDTYFLAYLVVREMGTGGVISRSTIYHPVLLKEGKWQIQHHVFCEEIDYIKNETCNYYTENKVDVNSLYKEMPTFGEWEKLIEDTKMRFLDE